MTVDEFNTALTDLETRVDRLRALYENWFRGYEKMEPGVARKDVERRVYGLRKELPRNTALRFRYHQLYQRYTTLATYWQRTARQIEEGTYRRQLQRIKRRRDDEEARTMAPPPRPEESSAPPPAFELNLDETLDVRKLLDDFDLDQVASALEVSEPQTVAKITGELPALTPQPPAAEPPRTVGRFARPNVNAGAGVAGVGRGSQRPPAIAPANDVARPPNEVSKPPAVPAAARGVPPPPPPSRGTGTVPMPPPPGRGTGTVPLPPPPSAAKPALPPLPGARPSIATATQPMASRAPAPLRPGSSPRPPSNRPRPTQPSGAAPARAPQISGTVARVEASGPSAREQKIEGLDEQRMRRIYEEYAAAKRKNNEGEIRYETLAGSISKMMPDLTKKHAGKQIDFEVVLKDGRVGLKPKAT